MKKCKSSVGGFVVYTFPLGDVQCAVYQTQSFEIKITRKGKVWLKTVHYKNQEDMLPASNTTLVYSENEKGLIKNYTIKPSYLRYLISL